MNVPVDPVKPRRPWRFLLIVLGLLLAVAVPVGVYAPDAGLRWGVVRGLVDMGWAQASVAQARLSLLQGDIAIRGMQAVTSLGEALGIDGIDLNFRWKPLLSKRLWLERLSLDKAKVVLERTPSGWTVNGLDLGGGPDAAPSAASPWGYGVTELILTDSVVRLQDGDFALDVVVKRAHLRDLQSWSPLAQASLSLEGSLNGAPLVIEARLRPFAPDLDFEGDIDIRGLAAAPFATWGGLPGWAGLLNAKLHAAGVLGGGGPISAAGRVELAEAKVPLEGGAITAKALTWQGKVEWSGAVKAAGRLDAQQMAFRQGQAAITAATLQANLDQAALDKAFQALDWSGGLNATGWDLSMDGLHIRHGSLSWQGVSHLNLSPKAKTLFTAEGRADGAETLIQSGPWRLSAAKTQAEGRFVHDRPEGLLPPLTGRVTLSVDALTVSEGDRQWLAADQARLRGLDLSPQVLSLARVDLTGLSLLSKGKDYGPRLRARAAVVEKLRLSPQADVEVAAVSLSQPVIRLQRDKTGFQGLSDLSGGDGAKPQSGPGPRFALGRLRLGGGQVEFRDRSTSDPVRLSLAGLALELGAMDSTRPDQDTPFSLAASIGGAEMSAQGDLRPFQPIPGVNAKGKLRALDLPPLSPYAADALGVNLHTGQLDAQIAMAVRAGQLDGKMDLVLSRLTIAQPDPNAPLAKQADMPIETVLGLLRDSEDRITLTIPVKGDLHNPSFDISDAVNQAIGGALKSTLFTTLKVAFPVVGLIGMVIDEAEKPVLALDAVSFADGSADIAAAETEGLGKLARLLADKDSVRLNVCGVASTLRDGPVLRSEMGLVARLRALIADKDREEVAELERDRLRRLADARAQAVKSWLVSQGGIDQGRLFTCRPRVEDGDKSRPRADLVL